MNSAPPQRILVIKLSALGDFLLAMGAFQAIRAHHDTARITLLTTKAYAGMARASGCFDDVWIDDRPSLFHPGRWLGLAARLWKGHFERVYDLQRSQRTGWYFHLFGPRKPEWIGIVAGCSHRYRDPPEPTHIADRLAGMLALAGIDRTPPPDLSFLTADTAHFALQRPYALLVPGSSAHRMAKRWPIDRYAGLAKKLSERGIAPVLICGPDERAEARAIAQACPQAHDVKTNLDEIAELARGAIFTIGNDTGPMHLIAAIGCPVLALFSSDSNPLKTAPRGPKVMTLQEESLANLSLERVLAALNQLEAL